MDILNHNLQTHSTSIIPIMIISHTTTPNMENTKTGKTLYIHNIILTKISLPRKILTNSLNEDLGIMQSNSPLVTKPLIARLTHYHNKNKKIFRSSLTKTFVLDVSTLLNPLWHHLSFLSKERWKTSPYTRLWKA